MSDLGKKEEDKTLHELHIFGMMISIYSNLYQLCGGLTPILTTLPKHINITCTLCYVNCNGAPLAFQLQGLGKFVVRRTDEASH